MRDVVERICNLSMAVNMTGCSNESEQKVSDEITALRAENERLQVALLKTVVICNHANEHYKGAVFMKARRAITVHVRATLYGQPRPSLWREPTDAEIAALKETGHE